MGTDDTDYMGVCIAPVECYFGLQHLEGRNYWEGSNDIVIYEIRKFCRLLVQSNPNVLSFLWNKRDMFIKRTGAGEHILVNKHLFSSLQAYPAFIGYAQSQLHKMRSQSYQGYMGDKRKQLVNKFGYDTKNAAHLIRLLKMGKEFLQTGELNVYRTDDREFLLDIKRGEYTLERIELMANALFAEIEATKGLSKLPEFPDVEKIEKLLIDIIQIQLN
jgi:predicted nucleotidyltransferase